MKTPKSVPATEFKAHGLALPEKVRETRQPPPVTRAQTNPLKDSILYQNDLISPIDEKRGNAL